MAHATVGRDEETGLSRSNKETHEVNQSLSKSLLTKKFPYKALPQLQRQGSSKADVGRQAPVVVLRTCTEREAHLLDLFWWMGL